MVVPADLEPRTEPTQTFWSKWARFRSSNGKWTCARRRKCGPTPPILRPNSEIYSRQAEVNLTCPVEVGQHEVVHTVTLPSNIPPGKCSATRYSMFADDSKAMYTVNIRGYTLDDDDLTCLDLWIDFRRR